MAKKQFKTESKRLLDLMANSIYTNTDIFLRELISNASDACDKRYFLSLTDSSAKADELFIKVDVDKKNRTITISDNGIGMNKEDLENNLGTIARSGSYEFKKNLEDSKEVDIIGQFGVGFYSAFMVANKIEVISKKVGEEKAAMWISEDGDGYEIKNADKEGFGTVITLYVKPNTKEKKYDTYLESGDIQNLIKRYSDFIRYPIKMDVEMTSSVSGNEKPVAYTETKTINSMVPLWKKAKKDIKDDDYNEFYMMNFYDYTKPLKTIHYKVEGNTSYTAMLFIPSERPYNYYSAEYKAGLKLYSKGVFIKDEAAELVSDHFKFIKGIVDSDDLNLNISREILQQDYQMNLLKKSIDKKIKKELETMLDKKREDYEKFFESFGAQIKYGIYDSYGMNKDLLSDLLIFKSSNTDSYTTLKEYIARMKEDQKEIFYAAGETVEKIKEMPQLEAILDKGYEVLYLSENIDEFMISVMRDYDGKEFKSIQKGDLNIETEEEKKEVKEKEENSKDLIENIKEILGSRVSDVRLSSRLKSSPVCLVSDDNLSIEMEKVLKNMNQDGIKANRILEINPDHEIFSSLKKTKDSGESINPYVELLYNQALMSVGLTPDDPVAYAKLINELLIKAMK